MTQQFHSSHIPKIIKNRDLHTCRQTLTESLITTAKRCQQPKSRSPNGYIKHGVLCTMEYYCHKKE